MSMYIYSLAVHFSFSELIALPLYRTPSDHSHQYFTSIERSTGLLRFARAQRRPVVLCLRRFLLGRGIPGRYGINTLLPDVVR